MTLRHGELKGLVVPLIGIDKFQPKTGTEEDVIVVNFHVKREEQAAKDLEKFLEMSAIITLDTETSPNPDEQDHWMVFVEFERDRSFWKGLRDLVNDVENTTEKLDWLVQIYKHPKLYRLNDPHIVKAVITDAEEYKAKMMPEDSLKDHDHEATMAKIKQLHGLHFESFTGPSDTMLLRYDLTESEMGTDTNYEQRILNSFVGKTTRIKDFYALEDADTITLFRRVDA